MAGTRKRDSAFEDRPDVTSTPRHIVTHLTGGWIKEEVRRKSGKTQGKWDIYLTSPKGTRLRSNVELMRYLAQQNEQNPDPKVVNFTRTAACPSSSHDGKREIAQRMLQPGIEVLSSSRKVTNLYKPTVFRGKARHRPTMKESEVMYLERQLGKIGLPNWDHLLNLSIRLNREPRVIHAWMASRLAKLKKHRGTGHILKTFDVLEEDLVDPLPFEDQQVAQSYEIEYDNAEMDESDPCWKDPTQRS